MEANIPDLEHRPLPNHVACIMDGNGRWAARRRLSRIHGHAAGEEAFYSIVNAALALRIPWLTLFAFSTENWNRSELELQKIMEHNQHLVERYTTEFHAADIRIRYLGFSDARIPPALASSMEQAERLTSSNNGTTLTIAFNYGGRRELLEIIDRVRHEHAGEAPLTEDALAKYTQYPDMPDVDLLVRTASEFRISNFMLLRLAYAELYFTDTLWPDFRATHLMHAIREFQHRERRFGAIQGKRTISHHYE